MSEEKEEITKEIQYVDILREPMLLGKVFSESGMFPDVKTQAQAAVKILAGKELGLSPFQSMKSLYMVNNRLGLMADVMAYLVKRNGKYNYAIDKLDDTECILSFFEVSGEKKELGKSSFSVKDAAKAGLINKDVWKNYPRNMMFARALSNGVRWYCPDAVCGYYTVEEIEDIAPPIIEPKKTIEITAEGEVKSG